MDKIQTLLFDLDGTLLDTRDFIIQSFQHTLSTHGYPVPERSIISNIIGKQRLSEDYKELTGLEDSLALQTTHRAFQVANLHLSVLFSNVLVVLKTLRNRGYKMAIITTRSKITSLETIRQAGIEEFFDVVISGDDTEQVKPHPAPLFKALEKINTKPETAVMIGDSYVDVEAGKNAGTTTIRVTYGFHADKLHESEPDFIINNIAELLNIFL